MFDDLEEESIEKGNFSQVKECIENTIFGLSITDKNGTEKAKVKSKLKICNCLYKKYKCKGYEKYIEDIKNIIKETLNK